MDLAALASTIGRKTTAAGSQTVDVITFIEAPWGLSMKLFPVQRVILKAHYGLVLDDNPQGFPLDVPVPVDHANYHPDLVDHEGYYKLRVPISDWRRENKQVFTEAGYLKYLHLQGRCNVGDVVPGHERREMILSIGRRSGKCVTGDTLVLTDKGLSYISDMGDVNGPELQPLNIGVCQEAGVRSRSAYFYNAGVHPTFSYKTRCGYNLEGTGKHRVRVLKENGVVDWKRLDEITIGDVIAVNRKSDLWSSEYVPFAPYVSNRGYKKISYPEFVDEKWGLLLGYLAGDGTWPVRDSIDVTVAHSETWAELKSIYVDLFGSYKIAMDDRTKSCGRMGFHSKGVRETLHNLGFSYSLKRDTKEVPWVIFKSPKPVVAAFLQGLFETDGCAEGDGKAVTFSSASEKLAREVQLLLLNFGVVSSFIVFRNKKYKRDYYGLSIRGTKSRKIFAEQIGFRSHKKNDLLQNSFPKEYTREGGDVESIPYQSPWIQRLLDSIPKVKPVKGIRGNYKRSSLRDEIGNSCKPGSGEQLTRVRLQSIIDMARALNADEEVLRHWEEHIRTDYFFDPVTEVGQGEKPVFDLNVPEGESFVANGVTNHNTTISACIAAYETYKLIQKGHPQRFYGLPDSNVIQIISVATDKDQAGLLYREVHGHFVNCDFFGTYMANATQSFATFQTPQDIEKFGSFKENQRARFSLKITFRSCVAKGLRGAGNIVVIMDEIAHFTDAGQSSAEEVYNAVTPSTSAFSQKDPVDSRKPIGPVEGRIILISSPLGKQGQFYKLFQIGMSSGKAAENMLCIEAPTWEVNPTVPASEFEKHYVKDPNVFFTEYGGRFSDRTRGWIEVEDDLIACVDKKARPKTQAPTRMPHYLGLDVALVNDYSAMAVGHLDHHHGKVVLDYIERIRAGEGKYQNQERLEFDQVADWVLDVSRKFYITEGMFDQWAGIPMEQALVKRGLSQIKSVFHQKNLSSQMYQNFKNLMLDEKLSLFDFPIPNGKEHCDYISELMELQAETESKYVVVVEAPQIEGKHDDFSDALVRMVWTATQHFQNKALVIGSRAHMNGTNPQSLPVRGSSAQQMMKLRRSGSHPSRSATQPGRRW